MRETIMAQKANMKTISNQKGASIIAVVAAMLILAVMGAALISLVTTGSDVSVNQLQSEQALYIADGGLQYVLKHEPYPNYSTHGDWTSLGAGQFKVDTLAFLQNLVNPGDTIITVDSTANFPSTGGRITIDTDFNITYTGTNPTQFTGVTVTTSHPINNSVYPSARLFTTIPSNPLCASPINIDVDDPLYPDDTGGFQIPGVIFIDTEYFYCPTKIVNQFQACVRCYMGSSNAAHPIGSYASQHMLTSTGQITNILSSSAQRVVKVNALPQ